MSTAERLFNALVGLSVLSWAAVGMIDATPDERASAVRISIAVLNLLVGGFFLVRRPLKRDASVRCIAMTLPSFLVCGLAFKLSPRPDLWPGYAEVPFVVGTLIACVSLVCLGRSFAVLPAFRRLVDSGPYAFVRHPMYLGEALMVISCFVAAPGMLASIPLVLLTPTIVMRIGAEESLLFEDSSYRQYATNVPWRLLPGVW